MYVKITTITEQNLNPRMWVRFVTLAYANDGQVRRDSTRLHIHRMLSALFRSALKDLDTCGGVYDSVRYVLLTGLKRPLIKNLIAHSATFKMLI